MEISRLMKRKTSSGNLRRASRVEPSSAAIASALFILESVVSELPDLGSWLDLLTAAVERSPPAKKPTRDIRKT